MQFTALLVGLAALIIALVVLGLVIYLAVTFALRRHRMETVIEERNPERAKWMSPAVREALARRLR